MRRLTYKQAIKLVVDTLDIESYGPLVDADDYELMAELNEWFWVQYAFRVPQEKVLDDIRKRIRKLEL